MVDVKHNILYIDKYSSRILLNNAKLYGNNYLTMDGKCLLTNLSNDEIIVLPEVEEIKCMDLSYRSNLKIIYFSESITKIKIEAFYA